MNMNFRYIVLIFTIFQVFNLSVFSQSDTIWLGRSSGLQLSGFARLDYVYDSRQTSEAVEGLFTFFPLNKEFDANGKDINAAPKANFISIASRLSARFYAADMFGAKSTAYIEFDFTGTSNTNGVRLRQAYINLAWNNANLLLGRTWHPLAAACIPNVVALNTGAPFWAFNRSDMLRFEYSPESWLISAAAVYQSDYTSPGPTPLQSGKNSTYLRDAIAPEIVVHTAYKTPTFRIGAMGSVKTIKPRLFTTGEDGKKYKTNEKLTTYIAMVYTQSQITNWTLKAQASYTQNAAESLMFGGYATSSIEPITGHEKYTPTQHLNYWINVDYGKKWQVGLFVGYLHNLGTLENVAPAGAWYARAYDVKYMYRLSPHLIYNLNNWQIATEIEYTSAAFGELHNNKKAKITNTSEVANLRASMMACFYF